MSARIFRKAVWALPLLVLVAALLIEATDAAGVSGGVRAAGAKLFYAVVPGVSGRALQRPAFADQAEFLFLAGAGAGLVLALARAGLLWSAVLAATAAGAALLASWIEARQERYFLDFLYPSLVLALMLAAGASARIADGGGDGKRLQRALAGRLPATAANRIARRPELLNRAGAARTITYLACGVRGLTELADRFAGDAPGFAQIVRRVTTPLVDAVRAGGGTLDQVAPGRITAFFNAPLDDHEHALRACACALRMTEELEKVNRELAETRHADGLPIGPMEIGIGVNTGPGIAAEFGAPWPLEYTVVGRAGERAEALKDLSATYGFPVIVSEATHAAAEQRLAFLQIDLAPAGIEGAPDAVFAALGSQHMRSSPKFRALQTFHRSIFEAYEAQDWERARELIARCRALSGASQRLYELYLGRVAQHEVPPAAESWRGKFGSAST